MKKILIVNNNLHIGGVQKALVNLLNCIHDQYDITLALFHPEGELLRDVPKDVKILPIRSAYRFLGLTKYDVQGRPFLTLQRSFFAAISRVLGRDAAITLMAIGQKKLMGYDVAISYLHDAGDKWFYGGCNDFVLRHVDAPRKITFLHCDYTKCGADTPSNAARYAKFDAIAACSDGCRDAFLSKLPELREKTFTVCNCQDYESIRRTAEEKPVAFPNERLNVLTVARFGKEKGVLRAIEAFSRIREQIDRFHYYILGDGVQRPQVEALIKQFRLEDDVTLLGEIPDPYGYMKAADLLLIPSFSEAAPLVIGEAACLGTPIVSTATSSARDMIEAPGFGWVCDNSLDGLTNVLSYLLLHAEKIADKRKAVNEIHIDNQRPVRQFSDLLG